LLKSLELKDFTAFGEAQLQFAKGLNRVVPLDNFMIYKDIIGLDRPD